MKNSNIILACIVCVFTLAEGKQHQVIDGKMYKTLFKHKHAEQLHVIKNIVAMGKYDKQYKMIKLALDQMIEVVAQAKVKLESSSYIPGGEFPQDEETRDALAAIVENSVLFGEMVLRLPDVTHSVLANTQEGRLLLYWTISFSNETKLLDKPSIILLNLVAQELGIIAQDPNYVNPYKARNVQEHADADLETTPVKKKKAPKSRGPQLSNAKRVEL